MPTGIVAQSSSERSQHYNEREAWKMLAARLLRRAQDSQQAASQAIYDAKPEASFGNQIRSYILHGQARVKDHRTGVEGNPAAVLAGDLDKFIIANLKVS